jgi:hypothetical protein
MTHLDARTQETRDSENYSLLSLVEELYETRVHCVLTSKPEERPQ